MIMDYVFTRSKRNTYSNKVSVGKLVAKFKDEFKAEAKTKRRKKEIRCKKKKHVPIKPSTGHVSKAILSF